MQLRTIRAGVLEEVQAESWQRRMHAAVVDGAEPATVLLHELPAEERGDVRNRPRKGTFDRDPVDDPHGDAEAFWGGPGQVIGYPVLPVAESPMENSHSVRRLETLLNTVCAEFGLSAVQIDGRTGVWIDADDRGPARRIATIDVAVSDGLALHRFALNCNTDLSRGDHDLPPSPSQGHRATSLTHELGREVTVADVLPALERHLPALIGAVPR